MTDFAKNAADQGRMLAAGSAFQIEGRVLRFGIGPDDVAVLRDGRWECQGRSFAVLECHVPTLVCFEDDEAWRPSVHGPFPAVQIAEGTIRWGADFCKKVAYFDEQTERWVVSAGGETFATVVLTPPPQPVRRAERQAIS